MKKFWQKTTYGKTMRGDLFVLLDKLGYGAFAEELLRTGLVQADDVFHAWRDEHNNWHCEPVERLGWGYGVSPSQPLARAAYCPGPHELLCYDEKCSESGECRRFGVRLDNTLHK